MTTISPYVRQESDFKTACQSLLSKLQDLRASREDTKTTYDNFVAAFSNAVMKPEETTIPVLSGRSARTWISYSMDLLALHMENALFNDSEYFAELVGVIAVTSRDQTHWAHNFGQGSRNSSDSHEIAQRATDADCVLEVARRALDHADRLTASAVNDTLRIIANCCADANANRELILQRQGLDSMLALSTDHVNLEILVPVLFNVCSEYDQPPSYPESVAHSDTIDNHPRPSYAAERLAGVNSSNASFATFELLLSFSPRISEQMKPYLSLLIELSTEPSLDAFHHVRNKADAASHLWNWSFSIDGDKYDGVALLLSLSHEDTECFSAMVQAGVCLLSQPEARKGLLLRSDDTIWSVLTLACTANQYQNDDGEPIDADFEPARKVYLKHLYEVTSDPVFPQDIDRASILIQRSLSELEAHLVKAEVGQIRWIQTPAGSSESCRIASACIILSQLALSESVRESLIDNTVLWKALPHLLQFETNPDVLYPAVTIISRLALSSRQQLSMIDSGILEAMQRLLTAKGLGLIVPLETVTTYKTICRGRPAVAVTLLSTQGHNTAVAADILTLWDLTVEAGTKLEIGKFFLEILRTVLPSFRDDANVRRDDRNMAKQFEASLDSFADAIGVVFTWLCTSAEPHPQRDHGWFGLAMLSVWSSGRQGILGALERHGLGTVVMKASQLQDGPVPNNLRLMLSNMQQVTGITIPDPSQHLLRRAARNLGLKWSAQDVNLGPNPAAPNLEE